MPGKFNEKNTMKERIDEKKRKIEISEKSIDSFSGVFLCGGDIVIAHRSHGPYPRNFHPNEVRRYRRKKRVDERATRRCFYRRRDQATKLLSLPFWGSSISRSQIDQPPKEWGRRREKGRQIEAKLQGRFASLHRLIVIRRLDGKSPRESVRERRD